MPFPGRFTPNLDEPIIPGVGLGGLRVGTHLTQIQESIADMIDQRTNRVEVASLFEARYYVAEGAVAIGVDIRKGKIFRLSALAGYRGLLFGRIGVGMKVADAFVRIPALYHNDALGLIKYRDPDSDGADLTGMAIDVGVYDPPAQLVPSMTIHSISVTITNLDTVEGQRGTW